MNIKPTQFNDLERRDSFGTAAHVHTVTQNSWDYKCQILQMQVKNCYFFDRQLI